MEQFRSQIEQEGNSARAAVPERISTANKLLEQSFAYSSLRDIERQFADQVKASGGTATANEQLAELSSAVRDEVQATLNTLRALNRWVMIHKPRIEDGGNFGVAVQEDVLKALGELIGKQEKNLEAWPEYFEKRGGAWDKVTKKSSSETKKSSSKNDSTGGKEGDKHETSSSESTESKTSESFAVPDYFKQIVAIDVKCYCNLHGSLQAARDAMLFAGDFVEKNLEKITRPKGANAGGGAPGFMF